MSKWLLTSIAVTSIPLIAGCTPPIFKTVDVDQGHGYSIDAQQRLILVTDEGGPNGDQRIVCAEPSPDALTAQAAAIAAQGGTPTVGIGFGGGSSEAAASIGLRTQTIQLLRDGYYRLCEAYLNGLLSKEQYNLALVRVDDIMGTMLAIDAIAGAPRAPAVAISPAVPSASASQNISLSETVPGGSDGTAASDSTTATSAGSTSVTGAAGAQEIGAVPASKSISSDEAKVLLAVVENGAQPGAPEFCVSLFADPNNAWYRSNRTYNDPHAVEDMKEYCLGILTASLNGARLKDILARTDPEHVIEVATLKTQITQLEGDVAKANDRVVKLNTALAEREDAMVKLSTSLAEKAIDRPIVV